MAHNLFAQRFYNRRSTPAWHGLGINAGEDAYDSARTAAERVNAIYSVRKAPIMVDLNGEAHRSGYNWIIREPLADDPTERIFGRPVPDDYEVITPDQAIRLYDDNVRTLDGRTASVETLGVLGRGERLFVTTKLPNTLNIRGDEVETYLLYDNPMSWGWALGVYTIGVRVVCQNTLHVGISSAIERRKIPHTEGSAKVLAAWLQGVYGRAIANTEELRAGYEKLANTPITKPQVQWIVDALYPMPKKPTFSDVSTRDMEERYDQYEYMVEYVGRVRSTVVGLYEGRGIGMDTPAVMGTAFGAYNAVSEFETYRAGDYHRAVEKLIAGERARRIRNAFALAQVVDRYETVSPQAIMKKVIA